GLPCGPFLQEGGGRAPMNRDLRVRGRWGCRATTVTTSQGTETQQKDDDVTITQRIPTHATSSMRRSGLGQPIETGGAPHQEPRSGIGRQDDETSSDETELNRTIRLMGLIQCRPASRGTGFDGMPSQVITRGKLVREHRTS